MTRIPFWVMSVIILLSASCTPHRQMVYFQDKQMVGDTVPYNRPDYKVKHGDILYVRILTMEEENYQIFNSDDFDRSSYGSGQRNNISVYINGYSVNQEGNIKMPVLGDVYVEGNSISEITEQIQEKVDRYLIDATVIVKLVNFNVTVLGEVRRPGNYYIYDNQVTVVDALGMAGDMTDFGERKVNIVRHTPQGAEFASLDMTDRRSYSSEYFYLQSNDIVYVEPTKAKRLGFSDFPFAVLFSAITTTILLLNYVN